MGINIVQATATTNTTPMAGRRIQFIVIHYTAGTTSRDGSAKNVAAMFARGGVGGSADFIVDDTTIVQYNPDPQNRYTWAVGGGKYNTKGGALYGVAKNANTISIEVCSTNTTNPKALANDKAWSFTAAAVERAVELTKYLMEIYHIDAAHVIRHYDVNGKQCPGIIGWNADTGSERQWEVFKSRLTGTSTPVPEKEEELDMTIDQMINQMTDEQAYQLMAKAERHVKTLPEPEWSKQEGHWQRAAAAGVVDGMEPERPMKRDEVVAVLGRKGLL